MAAYTGVETPSIFVEDTLRCSATIADWDVSGVVESMYELASVIPIDPSDWYNRQPVERIERNRIGTKVISFLDDYYYRIHVAPAALAFGAVLSEVEDNFVVWNSFFIQKTCLDIDQTYSDEYALSGESAPVTFKALKLLTYSVTVPKEGSANFVGIITFNFDADGSPIVTVSGIRMVIFPFSEIGVKESLECLTDILIPNDGVGSEQRISIRPIPRQRFSYLIALKTEQEQARFDALMFSWQKRFFGLPLWTEKEIHSSAISIDDDVIYLNTAYADYRDDSYAIIWKSLTECEAVKIETVESDSLILESPVVNNYTGVKFIMPCRIVQIVDAINRKNKEKEFSRMQIDFAVTDNVLLTGFTPTQTYLSLPVILTGSVIGQRDKQYGSDSDSKVQDYKVGDFNCFSDSEFNFLLQNWTFYNDTKAKCWDFRLFIHSLLGMQGTFWTPTYRNDLIQTDTIGAADISFRIENIKLTENMSYNTLRTHLAFIFSDGTVLCRKITGIVEADAVEEIVSIDSALGLEVFVGDCIISFLDLNRQASDVINIDWLEANVNRINQLLMMVKE